MEALKAGWNFFQGQILGMKWLYQLIGTLLNACGLDTSTPIGRQRAFFLIRHH